MRIPPKSRTTLDPASVAEIKAVVPSGSEDTAAANKEDLLQMARKAESRPHWQNPLAPVLSNYTRATSQGYDPDFAAKIKELAPSWFKGASTAKK